MKAWKKWMAPDHGFSETQGTLYYKPVLVIDASDFPENYPEIGSEWLHKGHVVRVMSPPYESSMTYEKGYRFVFVARDGCAAVSAAIDNLSPIPTEATGEVVGTLTVKDGELAIFSTEDGNVLTVKGEVDPGTYDIIKRGSK